MNVYVKIYNGVKYDVNSKKVAEVSYNDVKDFKVITGNEALKIGMETDENSRDEYNEYLVITFNNNETSTFCNSHVDLFIY